MGIYVSTHLVSIYYIYTVIKKCVSRCHFFLLTCSKHTDKHAHTLLHGYIHRCSQSFGDRHPLSSTPTQMGSIPHALNHQWKRRPPQNYHVAGAWSNQWLHVCRSQTDLLTFSPLDSHRSPGNPSLTPTPPRSTFPLLSVEHLHRPTSPAYLTHIERPDSAPELLVVLSVIDKGGQIEIQAERLHKHSWTVCVFLSVVTGWDKGWMDAWTTIWQTCNS